MPEVPDQALTIARIAGPYLVVSGLGFLISHRYYVRMIAESGNAHPVLINLSGAVHFVIGMAILTRHFNWSGFVEISITMLGVAAVSKGFVLIVFPAMTLGSSGSAGSGLNLSAIGFLLAGAWYSLLGYGGVFA